MHRTAARERQPLHFLQSHPNATMNGSKKNPQALCWLLSWPLSDLLPTRLVCLSGNICWTFHFWSRIGKTLPKLAASDPMPTGSEFDSEELMSIVSKSRHMAWRNYFPTYKAKQMININTPSNRKNAVWIPMEMLIFIEQTNRRIRAIFKTDSEKLTNGDLLSPHRGPAIILSQESNALLILARAWI